MHTILGVASWATVALANSAGVASGAVLTVVALTTSLTILARPVTFASGNINLPTLPGGGGGPLSWAFSTVELSLLLMGLAGSLGILAMAALSTSAILVSATTVYPQRNTAGAVKVLLRAAALHCLGASLLLFLGAPLLVFPAAFSVLLIVFDSPGRQVVDGGRRLASFWGPPLVVLALTLVGAAAVGAGTGLDLLITSRFVGD